MTGIFTLGVLGLSLSVDAFAAALGKGATGKRPHFRDAIRIGLVFGIFEAITPALGWAVGLALSAWITEVDHWIAFLLLAGVGGHMLWQAANHQGEGEGDSKSSGEAKAHSLLKLALTALATSIDATAVGVSLAVLDVNIVTACLVIGATTTVMATIGVLLGKRAGPYLGRYAEVLGGAALLSIGTLILYQHLTATAL